VRCFQELLIVGIFPFDEFFDEPKKPLPLSVLVSLSWKFLWMTGWVID
jgi:hypothetical protein